VKKLILFVKRKPGLTHQQFRDHYEAVHAPLAHSVLPHLVRYTRNFLAPLPGQPDPPYDCVTEFWFADQAGLDATLAFARTEAGQVLPRDEENFMDRSSMRTFLADEVHSSFA
jgi:uncharacterized protein (TIGR02118 family)